MPESQTDTTETTESTETKPDTKTYSEEEYQKVHARMTAADKNRSETEQKLAELTKQLEELQTASLGEDERKTHEVQKREKEYATTVEKLAAAEARTQELEAALQSARLENGFLRTPGVVWNDPEDSFVILQRKYLEGVEYDPDKNAFTGLPDAIKKMVKEKPHLVKVEGTVVTPSSEATGSNGVTKRKGEGDKPDKNAMRTRFPALGLGS